MSMVQCAHALFLRRLKETEPQPQNTLPKATIVTQDHSWRRVTETAQCSCQLNVYEVTFDIMMLRGAIMPPSTVHVEQ